MRDRRTGAAMLIVLAAVLLAGAVASAALTAGSLLSRARAGEVQSIRALQAAEGGLALAIAGLRDDDTWGTQEPVQYTYPGGETVDVAVSIESDTRRRITATGTVDGVSRTVELLVDVEEGLITRVPEGWREL